MKSIVLTTLSVSLSLSIITSCNNNVKTETKTVDSLQQVVSSIRDSINKYPNEPRLKYNLGIVYKNAGRYEQALAVMDSIQIDPKDTTDPFLYFNTLFQRAELYEYTGDTAKAIATLEQLVQPGELTMAGLNLARLYAETKNPKAVVIADAMIKNDVEGSAPEPNYFKGIYYYNTGDYPKAIASFDESITKDYNFMDAHLEKGISLYQLKKYPEAIKALDLALQVSNSFADAYYWKGRVQEAMGQKEEARLNYQRALGLDKDFAAAKQALEENK